MEVLITKASYVFFEVKMIVIKRDEKRQEFDLSKIVRAIKKANAKASEKIDDEKLKKVVLSTQSFIKI